MKIQGAQTPTGSVHARAGLAAVAGVLGAGVVIVLIGAALVWYAHRTQNCYQFNHIRQYGQCVADRFTSTGGLVSRLGHTLGCLFGRCGATTVVPTTR